MPRYPPEMFPPTITAIANAAPIAIAFPVAIITYKKNRVPKNSTTNLLIIGLDWIELIDYCVIKYYNINILFIF